MRKRRQRGLGAPKVGRITQEASVNVPGMAGAVWWPLFDYQTYNAAGTTVQQFFAVPKGQGGKTETDTNMELAGQIPAGQRFVITGVGVDFYPGVDPSLDGDGTAVNNFINDVYALGSNGRLKLTIGSKDYVNHGSLLKFPPTNRLAVESSGAIDNAAAAESFSTGYASFSGREFSVVDAVLMANQNFNVNIYDLPALPSTVDARIGINLYGWLYRNAQ